MSEKASTASLAPSRPRPYRRDVPFPGKLVGSLNVPIEWGRVVWGQVVWDELCGDEVSVGELT